MSEENNIELPKIEIPPVTIPAVEEKVYDKMWVTQFNVVADKADQASLYAILRPSRTLANGTTDILVQGGTEQVVSLTDLFGILTGTKIEPKLTPETIAMGGQLMGLALQFLKAVIVDKMQADPVDIDPITPPENII
jgi:hypothetical protein